MLIDRDVGPVYDPILIQGNITHFATSTTTNAASLDPQYNFSEQAEMWFHPPMLHPVRRQTKASTNHVANDNDIQHGSTASKDDTEYPASPWYGESS